MFSKGGLFSTFLLIFFILFAIAFFFVPIKYDILVNVTEDVPYEFSGEITKRTPIYSSVYYDVESCDYVKPEVNIRSVKDRPWGDSDFLVRYKCLIFNKENEIITLTYRLYLGNRIPFVASIPLGLTEPTVKVTIFPNQPYTSPVMYFNRGTISNFNDECTVLESDDIYKCTNITNERIVVSYINETYNGTETRYNTITKEELQETSGTLFRFVDVWFKEKLA